MSTTKKRRLMPVFFSAAPRKALAVCMIHGYDEPPSLPWRAWDEWCNNTDAQLYVIVRDPAPLHEFKNICAVVDTHHYLDDAWGTYKQVQALQQVLKAAHAALGPTFTHFAPITGSSIPLVSAAEMVTRLPSVSTLPTSSATTYEIKFDMHPDLCVRVHMRSPYGILTRAAAKHICTENIATHAQQQLKLCTEHNGFLAWDELHTEATLLAHGVQFNTGDTMYATFKYENKPVDYTKFDNLDALIAKARTVDAGGRAEEYEYSKLLQHANQYMFGRKCRAMQAEDVLKWKGALSVSFTDRAFL